MLLLVNNQEKLSIFTFTYKPFFIEEEAELQNKKPYYATRTHKKPYPTCARLS